MDLFCSLVFALSITEILLCEVNAHFPGSFCANHFGKPRTISMYGGNFLAEYVHELWTAVSL